MLANIPNISAILSNVNQSPTRLDVSPLVLQTKASAERLRVQLTLTSISTNIPKNKDM